MIELDILQHPSMSIYRCSYDRQELTIRRCDGNYINDITNTLTDS